MPVSIKCVLCSNYRSRTNGNPYVWGFCDYWQKEVKTFYSCSEFVSRNSALLIGFLEKTESHPEKSDILFGKE